MLRITKQADYALVLLSQFANAGPATVRTARDLSERATLPLPTVSKILKALARNGLLSSLRGVNGGYRLARSAEEISVADVISAIDGPISFTDCLTESENRTDGRGACLLQPSCPTRTHWVRINRVVADALTRLPLAEVARPIGLLGVDRLEPGAPRAGGDLGAGSLTNGTVAPEGPSR